MLHSEPSLDAPWPDRSVGKRLVIVGAGTIGLYLASLLAEAGWSVRLVESGKSVLDGFAANTFRSVGKPHRGIVNGRSRSIGGASNLWGGQLVEFEPQDLLPHRPRGTASWPMGFEELARHHATTLTRLGIPPEWHADAPVWTTALGAPPSLGNGLELFLTRWMKTPSMAVLYDTAIHEDARLQVVPNTTAVGFEADGDAVSAVIVRETDGSLNRLEADCFVIAAGTIESVRLLLAASRQMPRCPWAANPMLGRRFQDHLGGTAGIVLPSDRKRLFSIFSTIYAGGFKFQPKVRLDTAVREQDGLLGVQAWLAFESSVSEHLGYLKQFLKAAIHSRKVTGIGELFRHALACGRHLPPLMWTYIKDHRVYVPFDSRISVAIQAEQRPCDESRITIDPDHPDDYGLPRAVLDWRVCGNEVIAIRELAFRLDAALESAGLGRVKIEPDLLEGKTAFVERLYDTYHAAGGAVMAATDAHGVVDRDLRVFGTRNLFLASAAALPTSSSGNVTFTTLALATRLAEQLA
jgi:choline dehydrogenase-like flavoprotein